MLPFCKRMSICFANSVEEPFEPPHDKTNNMAVRPAKTQSLRCPHEERLEPKLPIERTAKALKCPRLNLFEAFNVIAIKLVVILNHFPGDKTVFYGIYLTRFVVVLTQFSLSEVRT